MFGVKSPNGYVTILPGISIKTLSYGNNMLMTEFELKKGAVLPKHAHASEQSGYLVKGSMVLTVGGVAQSLKPGDSWNIKGDIEHCAEINEDSTAIEVFSPVREDYFKYVNREDIAG